MCNDYTTHTDGNLGIVVTDAHSLGCSYADQASCHSESL
jgi:hypothetical protein